MTTTRELPTSRWREELAAGEDDYFSEDGLNEAEQALARFVSALEECETRDEAVLAVKTLVLRLNDVGGIDGKYGDFIETDEREELAAIIFDSLKEKGFVFDEDITEQWRTW